MANPTLIRTTSMLALIVAFGSAVAGAAPAQDRATPVVQLVGSDSISRYVPLGIGKSVVIDLPRDIKDVLVADPKIANAAGNIDPKKASGGNYGFILD
jgi:pilus assembly protein CpaC